MVTKGDLAVLQLECWVCACSWRPYAGQALPTSSSPVVFLGPGVGEMWGASLQAGYLTACWDKDHLL